MENEASTVVPRVRLGGRFGVASIGPADFKLSLVVDKLLGRKVFTSAFMEYPPLSASCDSDIAASFTGRHELRNGYQLLETYLRKFGVQYEPPHGRRNAVEYDPQYTSEVIFEPIAEEPFRPGVFNYHQPAALKNLVVHGRPADLSMNVQKAMEKAMERVFMRAKVPLYEFQKRGVQFLLERELCGEVAVRYVYSGGNRQIDVPGYSRAVLENAPEVRVESVSSRGGLLSDEVGLGKTLTVILAALAATELSADLDVKPLDAEPGAQQGAVQGAVQGAGRNTTLVVCPKHLIKQWDREFELVSGCGVRCVLRTATDFKKLYKRIAAGEFPFVVVPYSFFNSDVYQREVSRVPSADFARMQFARVVFDEVHELFLNGRTGGLLPRDMKYDIPQFDTPYVHLVSATPYRHMQDISALLYLLRVDIRGTIGGEHFSIREGAMSLKDYRLNATRLPPAFLERALHDVCMVRHTKQSIEEKLEMGDFSEETVLLDFSSEERKVYDNLVSAHEDLERLQRFCCYYNLEEKSAANMANAVSLEDIYEIRVRELEAALSKMRAKAVQAAESGRGGSRLKEKVGALEFQLNRLHEAFRGPGEDCPICLEPIRDLLLTNCGHFFCAGCLQRSTEASTVCPVCREPLDATKCCIKGQRLEEVHRFGTKLGNLVILVRSILKEASKHRVLVFSQYDALLEVIQSIMGGSGIPAVYPHGNVNTTNKQIDGFLSSDGKRVLLLSMNNCASGSNLKCVSHVVFLDNIVRDAVRNDLMKMQGIGRAVRLGKTDPVRVYHLKINDSIEAPT